MAILGRPATPSRHVDRDTSGNKERLMRRWLLLWACVLFILYRSGSGWTLSDFTFDSNLKSIFPGAGP